MSTPAPDGQVVLAGDILDWITGKTDQIQGVIPMVVLLLAAFVVIAVFVKTRAFVPTIIAFLLGAFLWFAVQNMEWLGERVQDEIQDEGRSRPGIEQVL